MDDAFYSDTEETSESKSPESIDQEEAENPTALLPKSALGKDCKPGDKYTVKVVKVYGEDEVEVKVLPHKKTETDNTESMTASEELDSMEKY